MADPERRRRRLRHNPGGPDGGDEPTTEGRTATTSEVHDPTPEQDAPRRWSGTDRSGGTGGTAHGPGTGGSRSSTGGHGGSGGHGGDDRDSERGLRGLIGSGASQVGVSAAMRARDASRPTEADLAEAEQRVVVIRRNWVPREDLPRNPR
ncbi:hypothetical protein [Micromonospora sp. NBC_01796]|uniref:hypothetical protein n=1 Tax=Micromonospora sp. NBC_01796 TaxID=2975987 RepID=UPI003088997E|nr:hypothetical protein OIE47_20435 [Micromonospora sp. NBC_01796]